jgi:hypothetical protein
LSDRTPFEFDSERDRRRRRAMIETIGTPTGERRAEIEGLGARTLRVPNGAAHLEIEAGPVMSEPFAAEFGAARPSVGIADGGVTLDYGRLRSLGWFTGGFRRTSGRIRLSDDAPWWFEFRRGVADLDGDLRALDVRGFDVRGGVHRVRLQLPEPRGSVSVRISGGANRLEIRRPAGSRFRLRIGGGVSGLALDDARFGAVGGGVEWSTPGYAQAADRYEIEIAGGARRLLVDVDRRGSGTPEG